MSRTSNPGSDNHIFPVMSRHLLPFGLALALTIAVACRAADPLLMRVSEARVTAGSLELGRLFALPPFTEAPMAVYVRVVNHGADADTLLGATGPGDGTAMLHGEGMQMVGPRPIPPGDSLVLAPGGLHLMFSPPLPRLGRGDSVAVTLHFSRAGDVTVQVPLIGYEDADAIGAGR